MNFKKELDILLIFPPVFYPHMPYLATPALQGALRKAGYKCEQRDLNVKFYNDVLTENYVRSAYYRVLESVSSRFNGNPPEELKLTSHPGMSYVIRNVEDAVATLRGSKRELGMEEAKKIVDLALDIVSDAYYPLRLTLSDVKTSYNVNSSAQVFKALLDTRENIFVHYFNSLVPRLLEEAKPKIICLSLTAPTQIIAGFTFLKSVREIDPTIKIIIGGNVVTRLQEFFSQNNLLSPFYDFIVIGEGEVKLVKLCRTILEEDGSSLKSVNNIVSTTEPTVLDDFATPDFDGLPLMRYFDIEPILPIYASRKCYWDRCTFCDIPFGFDAIHRRRKVNQLIGDIEQLQRRYGVRNFKFVDEAMPPETMLELSKAIIRKGLDVRWEAYVILEPEFMDYEFCKILYNGGCRWLYFGFESGDRKIVAGMKKGHNTVNIRDILKTTSECGIKNNIWIIVGFPGEREENLDETIKFVEEYNEYIDSIEINHFSLVKHAPIMKQNRCLEYGIRPIIRKDEDLALIFDYETLDDSISQEKAKEIVISLRKSLLPKYGFLNVVRSSNLVTKPKHSPINVKQVEPV